MAKRAKGYKGLNLVLWAACAAFALPVRAGDSARLTPSATWLPFAKIERQQSPDLVEISAADVERGRVELQGAVEMTTSSNMPGGLPLRALALPSWARSAQVRGLLPEPMDVGPGGALANLPYAKGSVSHSVKVEVKLSASARPGAHPWPVRFSIEP